MSKFAKNTSITLLAKTTSLIFSIGSSVIIARLLGPEGKGVYKLAILLPGLVVTFANFGIGPATVYHVGQGEYERRTIFGNNILLGIVISFLSLIVSIIIIIFFRSVLFGGVPLSLLFGTIAIIPLKLFARYFQNLLLGLQRITQYNFYRIIHKFTFLALLGVTLGALKAGPLGAVLASILSISLALSISIYWLKDAVGIPDYTPKFSYMRDVSTFGIKAHLGNVLGFLNYRLDMFLVSSFLNPAAVGIYSIAVGMAEKIWLVSKSASTVLFPRVSSETDENRRKKFTPIISRNIFFLSVVVSLALYFLSKRLILFLYSEAFLSSIRPLQILLPGVVALSVARIFANDLSGRGKPILNTYMAAITVIINVGLNIFWIPIFGINGAALASLVAYSVQLFGKTAIYWYVSGNSPIITLIPQKEDLKHYKRFGIYLYRKMKSKS